MPEDATALIRHVVGSLVDHPGAVRVDVVEGTASVIYELRVHPDDLEHVRGPRNRVLRALQQLVSGTGGPRKRVLDLIEPVRAAGEE